MPKFFIGADLVFFHGKQVWGGWRRFFCGSVYGVELNQTYTELKLHTSIQ